MQKYRRLIPYALRQWPGLLFIGVFTVVSSLVVVLQPWPLKILVDCAFGDEALPVTLRDLLDSFSLQPTPKVLIIAAALGSLGLFALNSFIDVGLTRAWSVIGQRMVHDLAMDLFRHLQRLPLRFHHKNPVGDSLSRLTTDTWCVYKLTDGVLISPAQQILTLIAIGAVALRLHAELAAFALVTVPLMTGATFYFGKRIKQRTHLGRQAQSRLMSFVHQTLSVIPVVQAFGTEGRNWQRYQNLAADAVTLSQRGTLLMSFYGLVTGLITIAGTGVIIFVGGRQVLLGKLSLGSFLVFIAYLRVLQGTAESLIKLYGDLKPMEASIDRVLEILDAPLDDVRDDEKAKPLPATTTAKRGRTVRFENVTFGYEPERRVLSDVTLEAKPGETVALVGPTGAGKSTLVSLIPRFYDPWRGRVTIDGMDVREMSVANLRLQIAVLLQETFLFPATVAENIAYGRLDATREEIIAAARDANADEFIRRLPEGYDTVIAERGASLSGGERQRLAIARALLKNAPVLILDEPTSALDAHTESLLLEALERLMAGRTTFIIAHRLSTIRRADQIAVLNAGRIVETGTHDQLLAARGFYHRLHAQQFAGFNEEVAV